MPSRDLKEEAEANGHSWATLRRAQKKLGIKAEKLTGKGKAAPWTWTLIRGGRDAGQGAQGAQDAQARQGEHVSILSPGDPKSGQGGQGAHLDHVVQDERLERLEHLEEDEWPEDNE